MRGSVNMTLNIGGEIASTAQTRVEDGLAGVTPEAPIATAGTLTVRGSASAGTILTRATVVETGDKAVLTWVDAEGVLKHRYNVACSVTENEGAEGSSSEGSGGEPTHIPYDVAVTGGTGADLPAQDSAINVGLQVEVNLTFDFDDVDTFAVTTNTRGVVVFLDATETEKLVVDMGAKGIGAWLRDAGFPEPISGTPVTHILIGSGAPRVNAASPAFLPKVLALYVATVGSGS